MRVIVIGTGIVGASAGFRLATADVDTVIVDGGHEGQATAAGAGIVFPWPTPDTPPAMAALSIRAAAHYPQLLEGLAQAGIGDAGYSRVGGVLVTDDEAVLGAMDDVFVALRGRAGMESMGDIEKLGPGGPAARFPMLREDLAGLWVEGVGRVDGRALRDALLRAASQRGARRCSGSASLRTAGDLVTGVVLDGEALDADVVVVAAGAWSAGLLEPLGVSLPVLPQRGQILHVDVSDMSTATWPVVQTLADHYMLAFPGGRVVAGATRESDARFDYRVTVGGVHKILTDALSIAPRLGEGRVAEVRVGFRPLSRDGLPSLGAIDGHPGLVVATGLGAIGLTLGPYLGAVAADLAMGQDPPLDLTPYRPDRLR